MSITNLFKRLGAPLRNQRWSWGALRESDGAVFMRVWQDRKEMRDRDIFMMVTNHEKYKDDTDNLGYKERLEHIQLVKDGNPCYMIMCLAKDPDESPRKVKSCNSKEVFVGGEVVEIDGDSYVHVTARLPVSSVVTPTT